MAAALLLVGLGRSNESAVGLILLGTFFRTGFPLVAGFLLHRAGGELARGGVFGMILCYYLVALLVETLLSVRVIGSGSTVAKA
jgi:hypothetical protein